MERQPFRSCRLQRSLTHAIQRLLALLRSDATTLNRHPLLRDVFRHPGLHVNSVVGQRKQHHFPAMVDPRPQRTKDSGDSPWE